MEKLYQILEFNKIKEMILKYNINPLSRKIVDALEPLYFDEVVQEQLMQTKEGYKLVNLGTFPSLGSLIDLTNLLDRVHKNATLSLEEIYSFVDHLEIVSNVRYFLSNNKLLEDEFFYTHKYINSLNPMLDLLDQIKYCVTPTFTLYDHASSKLKEIRGKIKKVEIEIKEKLNSYLKNNASLLSDTFIATRGNHYVLPVKASNKSLIKGLVIDVSDSKNTIFIEPYSVTESNILLEQLRYEEDVEIQRIIKALCLLIDKHYYELVSNNESLGLLSFMILKGTFGLNENYEIASLSNSNDIEIIAARHPLINKTNVVANDFFLGDKTNRIIVISGPNAGGKTVALKTIALLVLMNQCGLPIPVKSASLPIFRNIFVEIGDEQSIEQSLSGFSSHMKNVSYIINNIDSHSLVVIDELGSKTDPNEGEALAKAIIEYVCSSKAIAMITTHYLGIKDYAKESSSLTLASMGFNEQTLEPTYKLQINVIGRSYALEISHRLGLKQEIIDKAKEYKSNKASNLDQLIDELSLKLKKENEIVESLKLKQEILDNQMQNLNNEKAKIEKELSLVKEKAELEKEKLIEQAYIEIQQIVDEFKVSNQSLGYKPHLKNQAIAKLDKLSGNELEHEDNNNVISIGDEVRIKSIAKVGKVIDIKGNKAKVESANNSLTISLSELEKVSSNNKIINKKVKVNNNEILSAHVPMSVNLIGMHVDEALIALKKYLDAAMLVRYLQVSVIHGFGTGALRKAVHEYLKTNKYVESFELGGFNEGGAGATIVKFKTKKK